MIAPGRARRPGAGGARIDPVSDEELAGCPFCEGREERTPPETLALGRASSEPDTPGWRVRVVPNLYPAFERQEVVVHTPRHARSLAELADGELDLVAAAWSARRRAEPQGYLHALVNEGRAAGASRAHTHSQLVWFAREPPLVASERQRSCGVCAALASGEALVIAEDGALRLLAASAGRAPYELLLAPVVHEAAAFASDLLPDALRLAADGVRRLRTVEGPVPWNLWLHDGPHWHIELLPRLTVFAGIELGADLYVNTLAPERAAEALRQALV